MSQHNPAVDATDDRGRSARTDVPVDLGQGQPLSWELGHRVTTLDSTVKQLTLEDRRSGATLSVYEATENTSIVAVRTPVGREKFYEFANGDLDSGLADRGPS